MNLNLTIIGQAIAFFIFVVFCMKYVWPPITGALAERKKKIAEGLDAADRAKRDLQLAQEKAADGMRASRKRPPPSLNRPTSGLTRSSKKPSSRHVSKPTVSKRLLRPRSSRKSTMHAKYCVHR